MDYITEIENIRQQLFSLGLTEEKYNELLNLAAEEMDMLLVNYRRKI